MLSEEQVKQLKFQLLEQVKHLSPEQRKQAEEHIWAMSADAIESMFERQKSDSARKSIFRMIADKEVESVVIEENTDALAVLDINPLSEGHTIIIPKHPVHSLKELSPKISELSSRVANLIKNNLKAKVVDIQTETKFGELIINIIPSYNNHITLDSKRNKASLDELREVVKRMAHEEVPKPLKIRRLTAQVEIVKRNKRIP